MRSSRARDRARAFTLIELPAVNGITGAADFESALGPLNFMIPLNTA